MRSLRLRESMRSIMVMALLISLMACSNVKALDFVQLYVGVNGPKNPDVYYFSNVDEVKKSWIPSALTKEELNQVLQQVDFRRQVLLAFASGETEVFNGEIRIGRVRQFNKGEYPPIDVTVHIGRATQGCKGFGVKVNPFVIAALERPAGSTPYGGGYEAISFTGECPKS